MGSIQFKKQNNRLKRVLPGLDHYSGLVFYSDTLPTGFSVANRIQEIPSIEDAETMGITSDNASLLIKIMHYHISELFRQNKDAVLYVGIFAEPASGAAHTFVELAAVRLFSQNKIRQIGVFTKVPYVLGQIALLQNQYDDSFEVFAPMEVLYAPNFDGIATADLPSLAALTSPNVHIIIAQDGGAKGLDLYTEAATFSVGIIGTALGATSLAKVHENIGWVEKFNLAEDGGELDIPALSNGVLISTLANNIIKNDGTLDTKRLMFLKKYANVTGTYINDTHGACPPDNDYAYMEDNRAIDKAIRGIYIKMVPHVNSPVLLDKVTRKLAPETVDFLELEAGKALEQMEKAGELSGYTVSIDPNQDVNATNQIVINISNNKVGVSRNFIINIGY
jgi:Protein of unknown function (DUF2586)